MLIDWFTVAAQVLNFLILVWLLKSLLYRPILHAIDAREQRIAQALADADAKQAESIRERDELRQKNEAFDRQRAALLTQATDEAKAERLRLLDEARQAADSLRGERRDALLREQQGLHDEIARLARDQVFAIARKTLADLAGTGLEQRVSEVFTQRLRALGPDAKAALAEALKTASDPVRVRSAFELPAEQQVAIQGALNETFSADIPLRFETAPGVVSGIELSANGHKVAWSIAEYLASLKKGIGELLKEPSKPVAKAARHPAAGSGAAAAEAAK
jgi:F-type H+-transporting ATPase subunit b